MRRAFRGLMVPLVLTMGCRGVDQEATDLATAVARYHIQILDEDAMLGEDAVEIGAADGVLGTAALDIQSDADSDGIWMDIVATYRQAGLEESAAWRWDGESDWHAERVYGSDAYEQTLAGSLTLDAEAHTLELAISARDAGRDRSWWVSGSVDGTPLQTQVVLEERLDETPDPANDCRRSAVSVDCD